MEISNTGVISVRYELPHCLVLFCVGQFVCKVILFRCIVSVHVVLLHSRLTVGKKMAHRYHLLPACNVTPTGSSGYGKLF
jgi:hypothetical protein